MNTNKIPLVIPKGIRYLGKWKEFNLSMFPPKSIVDKKIPGCGFTRYCLEGIENVILCSPRKMLLENKKEQHPDIYLVENKKEPAVKYDSGDKKLKVDRVIETQEEKISTYNRLFREINDYCQYRYCSNLPIKIAVTYDSYRIVVDILNQLNIFDRFITVVDEFQSVLDDARFKADTELEFLDILSKIDRVCYVSATPMLEDYIKEIEEFKNLPFVEMDWEKEEKGRLIKPHLEVRTMKSIASRAKEIIDSYKSGNFEKVIVQEDGEFREVVSKEAVIYVNSVNHIASIIKSNGLLPEECNILCANTPENQKSINTKLKSRDYIIGKPVRKGHSHKMFTFCTRTVYLGADFYSDNARTFIFSDSNSDYLSVDISMDLPQILGRQRLEENPWNNTATFYYKPTADYNKMTKEDFEQLLNKKLAKSKELIDVFLESDGNPTRQEALIDTYEASIRDNRYCKDYVSVNEHSGSRKIPVLNNLIYLNEVRTFRMQQIDFKDRFSIMAKVSEIGDFDDENIAEFFKVYETLSGYREKLRFLCEFSVNNPNSIDQILQNFSVTDLVYQHFTILGAERCRSLGYEATLIKKDINVYMFDKDGLANEIFNLFSMGDKLSKVEIKNTLANLYNSIGYKKTPKASDLEEWFKLKSIKVKDQGGKWVNGFELIKKK